MDDKEYEWHGHKKEMNESNTPPKLKEDMPLKNMGSCKDVKWRMINNAQNGFSLNSPKFIINQKIMLFYLKFYLQKEKCGMTYMDWHLLKLM